MEQAGSVHVQEKHTSDTNGAFFTADTIEDLADNILGSHLILFIMSAVAVLAARVRLRRSSWTLAAPILIIVGGGVAMAATQSKGAMAACGIAILLWLIAAVLGRVIVARPRLVVFGLACNGYRTTRNRLEQRRRALAGRQSRASGDDNTRGHAVAR